MIDLDVTEFSLGIAESAGSESVSVKCAMMHELITRLRQAEKDAARYRCVKSLAKVIECEDFYMDTLDGQDLDAMVDECIEAMQCKE